MTTPELQRVADLLVRRAQREGFVRPRDVAAELSRAGLAEARWEEALAAAGPALTYHKGRYYAADAAKAAPDHQQRRIERAAARLIRQYRGKAARQERRNEDRLIFIQPIEVWAEDGRELTVLTRDLSCTGVRLITSQSLLGQKLHVLLPGRGEPYRFLARVLWSCAVGDDLFENGATFLDIFPRGAGRLRLMSED